MAVVTCGGRGCCPGEIAAPAAASRTSFHPAIPEDGCGPGRGEPGQRDGFAPFQGVLSAGKATR
jgi:hypothetical protein